MVQQTPTAPATPALAPAQVTVGGTPVSSPQAVYQGFLAQRRELDRQMESLDRTRDALSAELSTPTLTGADRKGLEARIANVDERIASLDKQMAEADAQVARSASVPGAAVDPPEPPRSGPPEEAWVLPSMPV